MAVDLHILKAADWQRYRALRLAALKDSPSAFASSLAREESFAESKWRDRLSGRARVLVATVNFKDAGLVSYAPLMDAPDVAGLYQMWVSSDQRGLGVGELLVKAVIQNARHSGFRSIRLDVADDNTAAIALYDHLGFAPTGIVGQMPAPNSHISEHERELKLI